MQIVKEPMDLKTMGDRVQAGSYSCLQEMRNDCELMCKNALLFNRSPGEVREHGLVPREQRHPREQNA